MNRCPDSRTTRSPQSSGTRTSGWPCCSPPCTRRSAGCWSAARRAPRSRRRCAPSPRCCRRCAWSRAAASAATPSAPIPAARTARTPHPGPARTRPARLVELPVGATEDRLTGSLDLERALSDRSPRVPARAVGRRAPRGAVRRRGQPAARPPGGPAAGRRGDGPLVRRAGRRLGVARRAVPAGRDHEPGGGRAPPAAARPVRADRRGALVARGADPGRGGAPQAGLRGRSGAVRRGRGRTPRPRWRARSRPRGPGSPTSCCPNPSWPGSPGCAPRSTSTGCAPTW